MKSLLAALAAFAATPALAAPPPASAFGRLPMIQVATISPDGKRIAILGGPAEDRRVSIATIDQPQMPTLKLGAVETVDLMWAGNDYVIAEMAYWFKYDGKTAYRIERNTVIDANAKAVSRLLEGLAYIGQMTSQPVIAVVAGPQPKAIIDGGYAIWRADVATGKGVIQEEGGNRTTDWNVDSTGEARVRLDADNHTLWVMGRQKGAKAWRPVWTGEYLDLPPIYYGYDEPDEAVYLYADKDGIGQLSRKALADGATTPVGPPQKTGMFGTVWDRNRHAIVGFGHLEDRETITWFDDDLGAVHRTLGKIFPSQDVSLMNWSADRQRFIVRAQSPGDPPVWYLYDKPRKELSALGEEYPELKGFKFGETRWIKYKARDGLEIAAYLTLPPPGGPAKPPLIVMPHGGPASRDDFDFDFIAQFVASRGYAVLRPEFRGSVGFGKAFEKAGEGEWGGKMQTDLLDGVAALSASGEVDTTRVCIVGASFGGYAALAGATLHPDAYRCAASVSGISDLGVLLGGEMRAYGVDSGPAEGLRRLLGKAPKTLLDSTSPARIAAKATVPVLLIHGDKDTIVPFEQSRRMADALKAAGKPVQLLTLTDENHYLIHSANRIQMLEALGAFLAKNLPAQNP